MKLHTALAVVVTALAVAVPTAVAAPDGYQPQLRPDAIPDAFDRYLRSNAPQPQPDAFERYLRSNAPQPQSGGDNAARHPDSLGARPAVVERVTTTAEGRDWTAGAFGALGGAVLALVAIAGASALRSRRLVLR
jgi:hypothetical protein